MAGAAVPYILTPNDERLTRLIAQKLRDLDNLTDDVTAEGMAKKVATQQELSTYQASIGQSQGRHVLVGEAYVRDIMHHREKSNGSDDGGFVRVEII